MKKLIIIFLSLIFFSCSSVNESVVQKKEVRPPDILMPYVVLPEPKKEIVIKGPEEVFSFSLREADIKDILRAIGKQTNYNVVIEPQVEGKVTLDLKNVTLTKALEYILDPLNYTYKIEEKTIYVSKPKIETRIFQIDYVSLRKKGLSTLKGTTGTERTAKEEALKIETETERDIFKTLEENLKSLLSPDGKIIINREASLLVVMDYPKNLRNIAQFLEAIQATIKKQVIIEAKIVEVELNESSKEGVNWAYIGAKWGDLLMNVEQALVSPQTKYFNVPRIEEANLPPPPTQYFRFGVISGKKFEAFIDLLKTYGKVNIISSPKIATLNNQRAVIKVATEDVFFESTTVVAAGAPATTTTTPKYVTVGLILDVTPYVDAEGGITMNIHPVLTEKVGEARSAEAGMVVTAPILAVREVDTLIRVKEGDSVIIGGLIKDKSVNAVTGLPGAMNIPVIGNLFRTKAEQSVRTELVIILTPKIIYEKESS